MAILFFAQTAIFCRFCTLKLRYFADFTLSNCDILHNKPHCHPTVVPLLGSCKIGLRWFLV